MLEKNPFDLIHSMNVQKEAEKEKLNASEAETSIKEQETVDQEYASLEEQKKVLVEDVEKFKQQIEEIRGTREEMISQYHEAINEAKKNPETLAYVKENFSDIFKEGKEKWQEIGNELGVVKESEDSKNEDIKDIDAKMGAVLPETSSEKLRIEQERIKQDQKELRHELNLERQEKLVNKLKENIENAKKQKQSFSDILDQTVEYTRENYISGEAKIISDDAKEFTRLWQQFPVNPFVISPNVDPMVEELEKKHYSQQDIENYKEKRLNLEEVKNRIYSSLQEKVARYSSIGFAKANDSSYPSFPYLNIGHGNHYFDNSLLNQQMPLGKLFDREIEIKTKQLEEAEEELKKIKEGIE